MNVLVQRVLFLLSVVVLKEPFLCVLGETYQNTFLCSTTWPADHSDVLLKRKQACDCCSAMEAVIQLSDGRNDKVAFSHQNSSKIIKRNSNKVCRLARQNSPSLWIYWYCKLKFYCQYMPTLLYLVWLLTIVNQHTWFGCREISGTDNIRYIKSQ